MSLRRIPLLLLTALVEAACNDTQHASRTVPLETIRAEAETVTPEMASFLAETIRYASVEPEGPTLLPETDALIERVLEQGRALGFRTRRAASGLVGVLEYGRGEETVGVLVHLDVVAPGQLEQWDQPPFSGNIVDGKIYGRGAQDDKGGLPSILWGTKILIDNGMTFTRQLRIIVGSKEETDFSDVRTYFAEEPPPDFGIAPDGPFIVRGESGYIDLGYSFSRLNDEGASGRDRAVYWDGGSAINSVPDFSYLILQSTDPTATRAELEDLITQVTTEFTRGDFVPDLEVFAYDEFLLDRGLSGLPPGDLVLVSRGQIAHSSIPQTGRNAIVEIALVGARMTQLTPGAFQRAFTFVDERIRLETDGSGFDLETEVPFPGTSPTTASLDLVDTDPAADRFELAINFRVGLANTVAEITEKTTDVVGSYGGTPRQIGPAFDAYHFPDDDPLLGLVVDSYKEVRGRDPILLAVGGTTYAKAAPNFVCYGPVDLAEDGLYFHANNEQFPVASLTRNAVLYAHLLQSLIQLPEAPVRVQQ